ncbi:MAG: glucose 1-dehydrogenase [Pseudomonadota bacterium]
MGRLDGKITLVTGAASGIGLATANVFADEAATVYLTDINGDGASKAAADIGARGGKAVAMAVDVSKGQDVSAVFRTIANEHGRLDVLVNNAGLNVRGDFRHMSDADWVAIREVNLDGVVRMARDGFELMKSAGDASLINIASIMGHKGLRQLVGYSATKGAVAALTRGLAVEYAPYGIRVNAIAPGFIETALTDRVLRNPMMNKALLDRTLLKRFGSGQDVAHAALFLATSESAYVTGSELAVDGGMSAGL